MIAQDPRIPEVIKPQLDEYITLLEQELPGFVNGLYLHGSIALGAFNERMSDIDFIALCSRPHTPDDVEQLRQVHGIVAQKYPRWALQGSYLQWENLGQFEEISPPYPAYSDGALNPNEHHGPDLVTWWLVKTRGQALIGLAPEKLPFDVDWNTLIAKMHENLNTYWASYTRNPTRMAWLLSDYGVQWAVLGVLRQYYTFREHDIISKTGAGEYALKHLPVRWHPLIQEAIAIRERDNTPFYHLRIVRAVKAISFLKYVIDVCNARWEVVRSGK
jgi:hypothetical protein